MTAEAYLKSRSFRCLTLEPLDCDIVQGIDGREDHVVKTFTKAGQVGIARCTAQVRGRFPPHTECEAVVLLLDPRTKNYAGDIIDEMGTPTGLRDKLLQQATDMIVEGMIRM